MEVGCLEYPGASILTASLNIEYRPFPLTGMHRKTVDFYLSIRTVDLMLRNTIGNNSTSFAVWVVVYLY